MSDFGRHLGGACLLAVAGATPIAMFMAMDRGIEIGKQAVAFPLVAMALTALLLGGAWRDWGSAPAATRRTCIALAVFLLLATASFLLSENHGLALYGGYFRREGLLAWIIYVAFFASVLAWARDVSNLMAILDAVLMSSIVAVTYAVLQRLDLNFVPRIQADVTRPGGTLGNPVFLAAFLALLIPITLVRGWIARKRRVEALLWSALVALQLGGLLMTQSRGPLLALVAGLFALGGLAAALLGARRIFLLSSACAVVLAGALIAINVSDALRVWAQQMPVMSRMVFSLDRGSTLSTELASRSASSRLGMWQAGLDTFAEAPLSRKLLGFGPDSAPLHYFPHIPAVVLRMDGADSAHTYDRLHADALDVGLNLGMLAWFSLLVFFGSVIYAALDALFRLPRRTAPMAFVASTLLFATLALLASFWLGLSSAAAPAFGLGAGLGWMVFMMGCAWKHRGAGAISDSRPGGDGELLLAGLLAVLLVFWFDAQINIPVLTTRLIAFGVAAMALVLAQIHSGERIMAGETPAVGSHALWKWAMAFSLVAACASFLPAASYGAGDVSGKQWLLRLLPIFAPLPFIAVAAWAGHAPRSRGSASFSPGIFAVAAVCVALYCALHMTQVATIDAGADLSHVTRVVATSFSGALAIVLTCLLAARMETAQVASTSSKTGRMGALAIVIALPATTALVAAYPIWQAARADAASAIAARVSTQAPQAAEALLVEAMRISPHEDYYRRQLIFELLGRAVADLHRPDFDAQRYRLFDRNLALAELTARQMLAEFPRQAWSYAALANVLQVRALKALRPYAPAASEAAAAEAHNLFERAHQLFPTQPLLLRNWAQLLFDQGNPQESFRLLDLMEKLVPNDPAAYTERVIMAIQLSDFQSVSETMARAKSRLNANQYRRLQRVAKQQQK